MQTTIERIYELCSKYAYSQGKLEKELGFSNGYLNTTFQRKSDIGSEKLQTIVGKFPDVNPEWLLTGRGEMLRSSYPSTEGVGVVSTNKQADDIAVTRVSLDFVGGSAHNFLEQQQYVEEILYLPKNWGIQQGDFAVNTVGESMYPYIIQGDTLILREVKDNIQNLILNKAYAFATEDQLAVKIIKKSAENSQKNLSFHSYNETTYPAFDLPKSAIKHVFKIIKVFGSR